MVTRVEEALLKATVAFRDHDVEMAKKVIADDFFIDQMREMIENEAPLTERILPYAKRVRDISTLMLSAIEEGQLSAADFEEVEALLNEEEDPDLNLDVELAVKDEIQRLANYLNKKS